MSKTIEKIREMLKDVDAVDIPAELGKLISLTDRVELAKEGIIIRHDSKQTPCHVYRRDGKSVKKATEPVREKRKSMEYIKPSFYDEVRALCSCGTDWTKNRSVNIRFVGPKGSGKTELVGIMAKDFGFEKVFQINGHADMDSTYFVGEKTVVVDEKSGQNYIKYQKGILELAMTEGLKKDENGDAILDADGNVEVSGKPAVLFIDEYAAIPQHISIVLNRALEIPMTGKSRMIELATDGGRKVKSHPGFIIVLSGNVMGKGCESAKTSGYTAQDIQQDDSTLDRISATYYFGYNLEAERMYIEDAIDNQYLAEQFIKFVDAIRKNFIEEKVMTLMSTRVIVNICTLFKAYNNNGLSNALELAIFRSIYTGLRDVEKNAWAEVIRATFGFDVRNNEKKSGGMFYI